ncbi:MAG: hypothetical protein JW937_01910, partial [Candidatus Omnitrophica bacterium]|nr:hypothetical protein [Candidatus Omnitrophota bacterium]
MARPVPDWEVPASLGRVLRRQFYPDSPFAVIHIQDFHAHAEAQENIAGLVTLLSQQYGVQQIALEGSTGSIDASFFATFPHDEIRNAWAEDALKRAYITGPEKAVIAGQLRANLYGVEDRDKYIEDFRHFKKIHTFSPEAKQAFQALLQSLEDAESQIYPEAGLELLRMRGRHSGQGVDAEEYFGYLYRLAGDQGTPLETEYPHLHTFFQIASVAKLQDETKLQAEIKQALVVLTSDLQDESKQNRLLELASQVGSGTLSTGQFA